MAKFGIALSSEEHGPLQLSDLAARAEQVGFDFALISDHFHPWTSRQPHSPFVWSVLGAISQTTRRLSIGTGVTCPLIRLHPALVAQAAATTAAMLEGRFFLGLGTGENLNEHILGGRWPTAPQRQEMLFEAVELIRKLWKGETVTHYGRYFTVEDARIFTLPKQLPPIALAAGGERMAELAGQIGDALISTAPDEKLVTAFRKAGGQGKPCYGQVAVCWGEDETRARRTALEWWPNSALPSPLNTELRCVKHFDQAIKSVTEEQVAKKVPCGPDPKVHRQAVEKFLEAGFDHVYVHQVGPDQVGFMRFYQAHVLPQTVR